MIASADRETLPNWRATGPEAITETARVMFANSRRGLVGGILGDLCFAEYSLQTKWSEDSSFQKKRWSFRLQRRGKISFSQEDPVQKKR
jgi:hypothetical protein